MEANWILNMDASYMTHIIGFYSRELAFLIYKVPFGRMRVKCNLYEDPGEYATNNASILHMYLKASRQL